jgi:putative transposase
LDSPAFSIIPTDISPTRPPGTPEGKATIARPDTILAWYRKLVARKFSGSQARQGPGRPRLQREVEQLIIRMASENRDWGYDRIAGAMANLGYVISDQTVGNVLRRNGQPPAPERKRTTPWSVFVRTHLALLAGTDFFTAEVLTLRGLVTYYVLFSPILRAAGWTLLESRFTRMSPG